MCFVITIVTYQEGELLYVPRGIHIVQNLDAVLAVGYVHQLDEKMATWNYEDSLNGAKERQCDVSAPKYLRLVVCYWLQAGENASNSVPEEELEEDLRWILTVLNETCDGVTNDDECIQDD